MQRKPPDKMVKGPNKIALSVAWTGPHISQRGHPSAELAAAPLGTVASPGQVCCLVAVPSQPVLAVVWDAPAPLVYGARGMFSYFCLELLGFKASTLWL